MYRNLRKYLFVFSLISIVVSACTDSIEFDDLSTVVDDEFTVSLSDSILNLDERNFDDKIRIQWSSGSNFGTGKAILYTIELYSQENEDKPLYTFLDKGKGVYEYEMNQASLNQLLLDEGFAPDEAVRLSIKGMATVVGQKEPQVDQLSVDAVPYEPVSDELFITGSATENGWDITKALRLDNKSGAKGIFVYKGQLSPGELKFAVNRDDCFCQDFYTKDNKTPNKVIYNKSGSGEDLKWTIEDGGIYEVTVDILNLTIAIKLVEEAEFEELWLVGEAIETGWDIDNPTLMQQDNEDSFIFYYEGELSVGEFKIFAGPLGNFDGEWYRPIEDDRDLLDEEVEQNSGSDYDNKWLVNEGTKGPYRIELNTRENTVKFQDLSVPKFSKLWIVGDATSEGWNINAPLSFVRDNTNEFVFVFEGELNPGEFKIFAGPLGNFDGEWYRPVEGNRELKNEKVEQNSGSEKDNKWIITESTKGNYRITLDISTNEIVFEKI